MRNKEPVWLEYCPSCKRKHYMTLKPCPFCEGEGGFIPLPKSEKVEEKCEKYWSSVCDRCNRWSYYGEKI